MQTSTGNSLEISVQKQDLLWRWSRKEVVIYSHQHISNLKQLKQRSTTAPVLRHPDPKLPFVVKVDASNSGLGAVLSQHQGTPHKLYPCAFYSRKLSAAERNYVVGDRELLALKTAFEEWHHWLEEANHPFTVFTDHKNLEYHWSLFFSCLNFTVTYHPGSKNTKADALLRQHEVEQAPQTVETILSPDFIIAPIQWDLITEIEQVNAHSETRSNFPLTSYLYQRSSEVGF